MKKLILLVTAACLPVAASGAASAQPYTVSDTRLGVIATFPSEPEHTPAEACPDVPDCKFSHWEFTHYGSGADFCAYTMTVAEFFGGDGRVFTDPDKALQWALMQSYGAEDEILSDVNTSSGDVRSREMLVRLTIDSFGASRSYQRSYIKVLVRAHRIYASTARCDERVDTAGQRAFIQSVRLLR